MSIVQNEDIPLLTSQTRGTGYVSPDLQNIAGNGGLSIIIDVTANAGGLGSILLTVDGKDAASGKYWNILTGAAITTVSTTRYRIGTSIAASANSVAQDYLPPTFRISVSGNTNPVVYSVGYSLSRA